MLNKGTRVVDLIEERAKTLKEWSMTFMLQQMTENISGMALLVTSNGSMGASNQVGFMQSVGGAAGIIGGIAGLGKNKGNESLAKKGTENNDKRNNDKRNDKRNEALEKARKNVEGKETKNELEKPKGMKDEFGEVVEKEPSSRRIKAEDSARNFKELKKGANSALGQA